MPEIVLSGSQPDAPPLIVTDDNTIVVLTAGSVFGTIGSRFQIFAGRVSNTTVNVAGTANGSEFSVINLGEQWGGLINIANTGQVLHGRTGTTAIEVNFDAAIVNSGLIHSSRGFGIVAIDPMSGSRVLNSGTIFGEVGAVYFAGVSGPNSIATLDNYGVIESGNGEEDGVFGAGQNEAVFSNAQRTEIFNSGLIESTDRIASGISISMGSFSGSIGTADIINLGTISSSWRWGVDLSELGGASRVDNSGSIIGGFLGSPGTDSVTNSGEILGMVALGDGNDVFDGTGGRVYGSVDGGAGNDRLFGGQGSDTVHGGAGADTIDGRANNDFLYGDLGNDILRGSDGNDFLEGGGGTDFLDGGEGFDTASYVDTPNGVKIDLAAGRATFIGKTWAAETLVSIGAAVGSPLNDALIGSAAANQLDGGAGADTLSGGGGADILIGGPGSDIFRFAANNSPPGPGQADTLRAGGAAAFERPGSAAGDRIDLSAIDANTSMAGNQVFKFGTSTGIGRLWLFEVGTDTIVRGNVNSSAGSEFELFIEDGSTRASTYSAADFIL